MCQSLTKFGPSGIPYSSDGDRRVESFLDDGVVLCSFEVFSGVSSVVTCAASFATMARVSAMTGRCLAETPGGISVGNSRSRSNCIHNKLTQTMRHVQITRFLSARLLTRECNIREEIKSKRKKSNNRYEKLTDNSRRERIYIIVGFILKAYMHMDFKKF